MQQSQCRCHSEHPGVPQYPVGRARANIWVRECSSQDRRFEETRSQHQANILTILRLLPVPSIGHNTVICRCQEPVAACPNEEVRLHSYSRGESTMGTSSSCHMLTIPDPSCSRSHNLRRATATVHVLICLTQHATRCFRVIELEPCVLWRHHLVLTTHDANVCYTHRPSLTASQPLASPRGCMVCEMASRRLHRRYSPR